MPALTPDRLAVVLATWLERELNERPQPLVVGLDGRSRAGKSTLAAAAASHLARARDGQRIVTIVEGDDFYAGGSPTTWDERTPEDRADRCIDWRRQRAALTGLLDEGMAEWLPFDWFADDWDTDAVPLVDTPKRSVLAPVVILEGVYSCRPELDELIDLKVLLSIPHHRRRPRLEALGAAGGRADWIARWASAEDHYFTHVMPPERFDLILEPDDADPGM